MFSIRDVFFLALHRSHRRLAAEVGPKLRDLLPGVQSLSRTYLNVLSEYCQVGGMDVGVVDVDVDGCADVGNGMVNESPKEANMVKKNQSNEHHLAFHDATLWLGHFE